MCDAQMFSGSAADLKPREACAGERARLLHRWTLQRLLSSRQESPGSCPASALTPASWQPGLTQRKHVSGDFEMITCPVMCFHELPLRVTPVFTSIWIISSLPWCHFRLLLTESTPHSRVTLCPGLVWITVAAAESAPSTEERTSHLVPYIHSRRPQVLSV